MRFFVRIFFLLNRAPDLPGYSDTGYSDILLTVTLLAVPLFLKCVTVSQCKQIFAYSDLSAGPEDVTVSGEICAWDFNAPSLLPPTFTLLG